MGILADKNTRVVVQGITGNEGMFHSQRMLEYGTQVVGGVRPGKGGEWVLDGKVPVFDSVKVAVDATGADCSMIIVPQPAAPDAMLEAADAGVRLIICLTEGIPLQDMMRVRAYLDFKRVQLIGPNCPGLLTPGQTKIGFIPGDNAIPGNVGVVSRSGTLTYEVLYALKQVGMGSSTTVGIGGDPVKGLNFIDILQMFEEDPLTDKVVMIGEIGGSDEEKAAEYISKHMTKPVVGFIAGRAAPPGKRMGHAGAIVEGSAGSAADKIAALTQAGVRVADYPEQIPDMLSKMLLLKLVFWAGVIAEIAIRAPYQKVWRTAPKTDQRVSTQERVLLFLLLLGGFILPLIYSLTPWLDFANYTLQPWQSWLGVILMALAVYTFLRAHQDLKAFWSPSLEVFKGHKLMTTGLYALIRHPMYASHWAFSVAQALLLQNWIAGLAGLVLYVPFYLLRVRAEEQMMLDSFGNQYRNYMKTTGRILPRLRR